MQCSYFCSHKHALEVRDHTLEAGSVAITYFVEQTMDLALLCTGYHRVIDQLASSKLGIGTATKSARHRQVGDFTSGELSHLQVPQAQRQS